MIPFPRRLLGPLLMLAALVAGKAEEVQAHGLVFERWVGDTFFGGYRAPDYTQRWDIPAAANPQHGGVPVNPKAVKYGTAVDLGDALRQYAIDEPFILLIGFWQQEGEMKRFVNIQVPLITPQLWQKLWAPITYADLAKLDMLIRDINSPIDLVRREALQMKSRPPFSEAIIQVNPKIGSNGQRRLQCSIRFADVFKYLLPGADSQPQEKPMLWGQAGPDPIHSPPRDRSEQ